MSEQHALDRMVRLVRELVPSGIRDEEIIKRFQSFRISIVADANNLSTNSGQTSLVTLVSLVARMGVQVNLIIPDIKLIRPQPPLRSSWLLYGLIDLGNDLIPGSLVTHKSIGNSDMQFIIGDTPRVSFGVPTWRLCGTEWRGEITQSTFGKRWREEWPIGAMAASALGAAEVFKGVVRQMQPSQFRYSEFLAIVKEAKWDFGECPITDTLDCGFVDLISAGAINQAAMFVLYRVPGVKLASRVFDDDMVDHTTLNRGQLTRRSDCEAGRSKVGLLAQYAQMQGMELQGIPERIRRASLDRYAPLAPSVIVGVDDIPARWEVQRACSGLLCIGGTSHFCTLTSSHEVGEPCGACLHYVDDPQGNTPIPTVSFVSFWAGLALAVRFLRYKLGKPYDHQKQALWLATLRMDDPNAGWWSPVAARKDCPIRCGVVDISKARVKSST